MVMLTVKHDVTYTLRYLNKDPNKHEMCMLL